MARRAHSHANSAAQAAAEAAKAWQVGQSMALTSDATLARHLSDPSRLAAQLQQAASLPRDGAEGPTWHDLVANLETVDWVHAIRCATRSCQGSTLLSRHNRGIPRHADLQLLRVVFTLFWA